MSPEPRAKLWGLVTRRERWGLSWRGHAALLAVFATACLGFIWGVYDFFAINAPVSSRLLVVEGWIDAYAIKAAADEFQLKGYERVFTTGGPVHGTGGTYTNDFNTAASIGAGRLKAAGLPADRVQMVPSRVAARDRTYSSAVALRAWLRENNVRPTGINVVTEDVHARRTRLLFEKAFGDEVEIGIISVSNPDYDARRWWRYSEGVRAVLGECIAYIYARCFFHPAPPNGGA